jgi:hypothetical protein
VLVTGPDFQGVATRIPGRKRLFPESDLKLLSPIPLEMLSTAQLETKAN